MAEEKVHIDPVTGTKIPMKDGKPCRVCVDFKTWSKIEKGKGGEKTSKAAPVAATSTTSAANTTKTEPVITEEWKRNNCPADVETLGRHTWTLLHTMAAYYPQKPEPQQKESMKSFFKAFSENYPCWFCKNDFQKDIAEEPINVASREALSEWLCRRHNKVNEKLGKKQFDCTKVFERWLTGPANGDCDK
ncbi:putative regulatory protein [Helicostylum pulchrum]|uniref:Sulfhydryl oxidase n=1 Tax=Helicostylum pulchrum TaxID=562976 RepID=A0ABP9YBD2_9FUNG|nr:putative regulatory protein [Helicostylum pulchrum]